MNEQNDITGQAAAPAADSGNIMQHIQDMIGDLLKNTVEKAQKTEVSEKLGVTPAAGDIKDSAPQMDIAEIKSFVSVMQKFIDNVNVMVLQLETGSINPGDTDEAFLDGYMATADNVLEIAAFSMKDTLTGLSNRSGFDNRLILEWNRAKRDKSALSLVIFDVDGFDSSGNTIARDELLKAVSETLNCSIKRTTDFIARWGDNEFAALLPITNTGGATIVAERIRTEVENITIPGIVEESGKLSVSIGVCVQTPEPHELPADIIKTAYDAFSKAKEAEGNSIIFA